MTEVERTNFLKGFAIIAVVIIHTINYVMNRTLPDVSLWPVLITLDQLMRFSVPLFIALSGFALAQKYSKLPLDLKDFYLHRVTKLLPAYFVWTGIYYFTTVQTAPLWQILLLGKAEYHLYFVPMIFQAYLLFPLLFFLIKKIPWMSLVISMIMQYFIFRHINQPGWTDQNQYILFISWQLYFVLGIFLALAKPRWLTKIAIVILPLGLMASVLTALSWWGKTRDIIWATRFTRSWVELYAVGVIILSIALVKRLKFQSIFDKTIIFLGVNSYQIFLGHVFFLLLLFAK